MSKVAYYYNEKIGNYLYSLNHPMKPFRVKMTDTLISSYGLKSKLMDIFPDFCDKEVTKTIDFSKFHTDEYVEFLKKVNPDNQDELKEQLLYFNMGEDCPVFDGIYDYCMIYTCGSILGAHCLNSNQAQIAINWSGGLHHAKKHQASGFCYINDCVLAVLELLKYHSRVLYIDIDIHHGDGVEEAFFTTDRVLTLSFHKYGDYFPGTGSIYDRGVGRGLNHSLNVPFLDGMNDTYYEMIFKSVVDDVIDKFRPGAIVLQCGADSLSGDRLGCFNLSVKGHGSCIKHIKSLNIPTLVIGGGGYTLRNVPRCWTYETGLLVGEDLDGKIPNNDYSDYFFPEYSLHVPVTNMENNNSIEYLNFILENIQIYLKELVRYNGEETVENYLSKSELNAINEEALSKDEVGNNNPDITIDNYISK